MDALKKFLSDRGNNNLVVAFLLAFSTANFVQGIASNWEMGTGGFWRELVLRQIIAYATLLFIAWRISLVTK